MLSSLLAVGIACTTEVVRFDHRDAGVADVLGDANLPADLKLPIDELSPSGTGFSRYVQYACCKSAPGSGCMEDIAGGPSSCESAGAWKTYVAQKCEALGMFVGKALVYGDCSPPSDQADTGVDAQCFSTENQNTRCRICGDVASCENLNCKPLPDDPSGNCQFCFWSEHPLSECSYCVDGAGNVLKDSCHSLTTSGLFFFEFKFAGPLTTNPSSARDSLNITEDRKCV